MGKLITSLKKIPTIAACGLDCGLCPRFYTNGPSRCPGCGGPDFLNKHPSCSFITCCVKKKNHEVCGECSEFPCAKFKTEEEYKNMTGSSSYPPPRNMIPNLTFIKNNGIQKFVDQQRVRINLLKTMIAQFDDGRSRSYFCRVSALLDTKIIQDSIDQAILKIKTENIQPRDMKRKAKIIRSMLDEYLLDC